MLDPAHYEIAGPSLLASTPPLARGKPDFPLPNWADVRDQLERRLMQMRSWRLSWVRHWQLLSTNILPRRSLWLTEGGYDQPVPNSMLRGNPINQAILDPTGTLAMRICAAGMMSGLTSPSRPWFKLKARGIDESDLSRDARIWIDEVESRIYATMAGSNFYDSLTQLFEDLIVFGTAPLIIYEDRDQIIRCYNPVAGEYYLAVGSDFRVESLYRLFVLTVAQTVEMFGLKNCPPDIQAMWQQKGANLETERMIAHAIEPNFAMSARGTGAPIGVVPGGFTWREVYWVWGQGTDWALSQRGFRETPFIAPRWAITANDPYGRSPGMDALPDIMQLQVMTARNAEAIEKANRPPLKADVSLKNQPSSILPGHVTYVSNIKDGGMAPIYTVNPDIEHMTVLIREIQARIQKGFFNDLFLLLTTATKDMTAYEVAQRQQEKLQVLGPVIERFQNEGAGPAIKRIFSILQRKGALPPLPDDLRTVPIEIEYISMLTLAQRGAATAAIERFLTMATNMGAVPQWSGAPDNVNSDEALRVYADHLTVEAKLINPKDKVKADREARAKQQAAAAKAAQSQDALQNTLPAVAGAAKTASEIDLGGGLSALNLITGQQAPMPAGA